VSGPATGFGYYPPLTGLRGVAIAMVVAGHLGLPVPGGGVVGVTLFFVLSGFLITSLIVAEAERNGTIDLPAFYLRRARRLVPPLVVVVGLFMALEAVVGLLPATIGNNLLALSYMSNWARAAGEPMGIWNHTWSLAIEEQFYLVWPALLLVVLSRNGLRSRWLIALILAAALASALLRALLLGAGAGDERIYFGSDTRAEAILLGSAIALVRSHRWAAPVPGWIGAAAIGALGALGMVDPTSIDLWPGATYSVVAGVAGVSIIAGLQPGRHARLLGCRPLTWLGDRSYSLYLWHVPVIMIAAAVLPAGTPAPARMAIALGVSMTLSSLSYVTVERRYTARRRQPTPSGPTPAPAAAAPAIAAQL
jgi:peptidoglycan/LPS O-acetylase OafA/YrhL